MYFKNILEQGAFLPESHAIHANNVLYKTKTSATATETLLPVVVQAM